MIVFSLLSDTEDAAAPAPTPLEFDALLRAARALRLKPVAVRGGHSEHQQLALQAGLVLTDEVWPSRETSPKNNTSQGHTEATPTPREAEALAPPPSGGLPALIVDKPLRSGQQVYARGRDLVVLAMVNPGAEVIADGHIHVYAPLRGKAIAGARGNTEARIFALAMEPELVSIAGIYRTSEVSWPDEVLGKPTQVRLFSGPEGDKLVMDAIKP